MSSSIIPSVDVLSPGANLEAYIQAVSGIALLSVEQNDSSMKRTLMRLDNWLWRIYDLSSMWHDHTPAMAYQKLTSFRKVTSV